MRIYKTGDKISVDNKEYILGEEIELYATNLEFGETYIEHTGINPDRFQIFKKDYDTITIENSWKIKTN